MAEIIVEKVDEVHLRIFTDDGLEQELSEYFTFDVPNAKWTPKFKARIWDGKIRLFNSLTKTLPYGLISHLYHFAKDNNHTVKLSFDDSQDESITLEIVDAFIDSIPTVARGVPLIVDEFQRRAIYVALRYKRRVLLAATSAGKSLIIYYIIRWVLQNPDAKCILIVPTKSLVSQMFNDFIEYSQINGFDVYTEAQELYSGKPKEFTTRVLISTWQSIYKNNKDFFNQFDCLIGDEAHGWNAKSCSELMLKCTQVRYKIGTSGTLQDAAVNKLQLQGLFGKVTDIVNTKQLMDAGRVTRMSIKCLLLQHPEHMRKALKGSEYKDEISHLVDYSPRNAFIKNLTLTMTGVTVVMFTFITRHAKPFYQKLLAECGDRPVYFLDGSSSVEYRNEIKDKLATDVNPILITSYQLYSTGINVPTIRNIILAAPTRSKIRILQTIGRGLRLHESKTQFNLYDIADDLSYKSYKNSTLLQLIERVRIYNVQKFDYKIFKIPL